MTCGRGPSALEVRGGVRLEVRSDLRSEVRREMQSKSGASDLEKDGEAPAREPVWPRCCASIRQSWHAASPDGRCQHSILQPQVRREQSETPTWRDAKNDHLRRSVDPIERCVEHSEPIALSDQYFRNKKVSRDVAVASWQRRDEGASGTKEIPMMRESEGTMYATCRKRNERYIAHVGRT
jgi:hypothetical protein